MYQKIRKKKKKFIKIKADGENVGFTGRSDG